MDEEKVDAMSYDVRSNTYDKESEARGYTGANVAARTLAKIICGNRKNKVILDIGGGTGLVGEELKKEGFEKIDILDASEKMLEFARQRNVYRNVIMATVKGHDSTSLKHDSYDAVLGVSIFCHVGPSFKSSDIKEMIRLAKPGGVILLILRTETLYCLRFRNSLLPLIESLRSEGILTLLEQSQFKYMYGVEGQLFVFRKQHMNYLHKL